MEAPGPSGAPTVASSVLSADDTRKTVSRGPQHVPALHLGAGRAVQSWPCGHGAPVSRPCSGGTRLAVTSMWSSCPLAVQISSPEFWRLRSCASFLRCVVSHFAFEQFASQQFCTFLATKFFELRKPQSEPFPSVCSDSVSLLLIHNIRLVT